jgi:hypothetical protein
LWLRENNEGNTACIVLDVGQKNKKHFEDEKSSKLRSILQVTQLVIPPRDCKHPIGTIHERGYYFFFVPGMRE